MTKSISASDNRPVLAAGAKEPEQAPTNPNRPSVELPEADRFEAIIVGGGAAGLAAAAELGIRGVHTALVDEAAELGGQYYRQRLGQVRAIHGDHRPNGSNLISRVRSAGVEVRTRTLVWGAEPGRIYTSDSTGGLRVLEADNLLLATGAHEKVVPFSGWTLPGVCTAGAALHWAHVDRVAAGRRVVVAGTGPLILIAAAALLDVGAEVAALVELNQPYRIGPAALQGLARPWSLWTGMVALAHLRRNGVEIMQGWIVAEAKGSDRVEQVTLVRLNRPAEQRVLSVDALCVSHGFRLESELARILGCECRLDPVSGDLAPVVGGDGHTSVLGVFVAGEAAGLGGVEAAIDDGRRAAHGILAQLDHGVRRHSGRGWRSALYGRLLTDLCHVPASLYSLIPDATYVCRCESVTAGEVRGAAATSWIDLGGAKALTRAGMGACQGRECEHTVQALAGRHEASFTARMPVRPISMPEGRLESPVE